MADETTTQPWHATLDEETRGYVVNKGWDKHDAPTAAVTMLAAYRQAEKAIGVPDANRAYVPTDPADPRWNDLYQKLGAPKDAKDYSFEGVKFKDGSAPEAEFLEQMRGLAAELHLPAASAPTVAARFLAIAEQADAQEALATAARVGAEDAALRQNWGANYDLNMFVASKGAETLGLTKAQVDAIVQQASIPGFMEQLRQVGSRLGEAALLRDTGGTTVGALTREQAVARKAALYGDAGFRQRYVSGDAAAVKEMRDIDTIIVGPDPYPARR